MQLQTSLLGRCQPTQVESTSVAATNTPPGQALEIDGCGARPPPASRRTREETTSEARVEFLIGAICKFGIGK